MEKNLTEIKIGQGLGILKFGMSRDQVKEILGEAGEMESYSYTNTENDMAETWHYDALEVSLGFDEEDDWRLVSVSVTSDYCELNGNKLIGMKKEELEEVFNQIDIKDLETEDWSSEESPNHWLITSDSSGINFWLDDDVLSEIQWNPIFIDDDTIAWPK